MRILIDTNIFINRENYHVVPGNLQQLFKTLGFLKAEILVHPESIEELRKDSDEIRKVIGLSKISTYSKLASPPDTIDDIAFSQAVGTSSNEHDKVDNALIYAVYRDAVDFLISEDKGITSKALKVNLGNRVFSVDEAIEVFRNNVPKTQLKHPPALVEDFIYNLSLSDTFFDSIRDEYPRFDEWFRKVSREGRKCWVHFEGGSVRDLLIFKDENEPISSIPPLPSKRRLKLCTLKATSSGHRIGELFIKLAVEYCVNNRIDQTYLTHYVKGDEDPLVELLSEYGFLSVAKKDGEDVFLKELIPNKRRTESMSPSMVSSVFYPGFYDGPLARKIVVPIRPEYHDRLFTEYRGRQTTLPEHAGNFIVEGNTIKKAYLCHSSSRRVSEGDVLLFYRSKDSMELTTLGVVEDVFFRLKDSVRVMKLVGNRTVYSVEEIERLVSKPTLVLLFKWLFYFPRPIGLEKLKSLKILKDAPQTLTRISHRKYLELKKAGGLDERYTVN